VGEIVDNRGQWFYCCSVPSAIPDGSPEQPFSEGPTGRREEATEDEQRAAARGDDKEGQDTKRGVHEWTVETYRARGESRIDDTEHRRNEHESEGGESLSASSCDTEREHENDREHSQCVDIEGDAPIISHGGERGESSSTECHRRQWDEPDERDSRHAECATEWERSPVQEPREATDRTGDDEWDDDDRQPALVESEEGGDECEADCQRE
jgi:hypothetical protein